MKVGIIGTGLVGSPAALRKILDILMSLDLQKEKLFSTH